MQILAIGNRLLPARAGKSRGVEITREDKYRAALLTGHRESVAAGIAAGLIYVRGSGWNGGRR